MDFVYGFGVTSIQYTQERLRPDANDLEMATKLTQPYMAVDHLFPIIAVVDSVFASQLIISLSAGTWLSMLLKWCLQEPRPYWWVQSSSYYMYDRPTLRQFSQTCETTLGSPSMHTMTAASMVMLVYVWFTHVMNDYRSAMGWWCNYIMYPMMSSVVLYVCVCRMYVAASFPHQCILGACLGLFTTTAMCVISDRIIWKRDVRQSLINKLLVVSAVLAAIEIARGYLYPGLDWGATQAEKYCQNSDWIEPTASGRFYNIESIGTIIGWLLTVSPKLSKFRHYTRRRSIIISILCSIAFYHAMKVFETHFDIYNSNMDKYRIVLLFLYITKPMYYLYVVPYIATLAYKTNSPIHITPTPITNTAPIKNSPPAL